MTAPAKPITLAKPITRPKQTMPVGARLLTAPEWQRLLARERGGLYGVVTMRIYCRFGCPSRPPLRQNAVMFDTPAAAEAAGFRACKRCGGWPVSQPMG
jgi:methylphosphotriester-DNA--protein-cysteine methyltransferase